MEGAVHEEGAELGVAVDEGEVKPAGGVGDLAGAVFVVLTIRREGGAGFGEAGRAERAAAFDGLEAEAKVVGDLDDGLAGEAAGAFGGGDGGEVVGAEGLDEARDGAPIGGRNVFAFGEAGGVNVLEAAAAAGGSGAAGAVVNFAEGAAEAEVDRSAAGGGAAFHEGPAGGAVGLAIGLEEAAAGEFGGGGDLGAAGPGLEDDAGFGPGPDVDGGPDGGRDHPAGFAEFAEFDFVEAGGGGGGHGGAVAESEEPIRCRGRR